MVVCTYSRKHNGSELKFCIYFIHKHFICMKKKNITKAELKFCRFSNFYLK